MLTNTGEVATHLHNSSSSRSAIKKHAVGRATRNGYVRHASVYITSEVIEREHRAIAG